MTGDQLLEQQRAALQHANTVRFAIAEAKRAIRNDPSGGVLLDLLADGVIYERPDLDPTHLGTMRVVAAITAVRGIADVKAARILADAGVGLRSRLRNLTPRQRAALAEALVIRLETLDASRQRGPRK